VSFTRESRMHPDWGVYTSKSEFLNSILVSAPATIKGFTGLAEFLSFIWKKKILNQIIQRFHQTTKRSFITGYVDSAFDLPFTAPHSIRPNAHNPHAILLCNFRFVYHSNTVHDIRRSPLPFFFTWTSNPYPNRITNVK